MDPSNLENAKSAATQIGAYSFQVAVCLLLAALIWKCINISRRPNANGKCATSLALVLGGFLASIAPQLSRVSYLAMPRGLLILFIVVFVGLVASGLVLAIIGLVEYARHSDYYVQGRTQAISAIIVGGILLSLFGFGTASVFKESHQMIDSLKLPANQMSRSGEPITFEPLNFQFKTPGKPWMRVNAAKLNRLASLAFMSPDQQMFFQILVENKGIDPLKTSSDFLELSKKNMSRVGTAPEFKAEFPETIDGMNGMHLESHITTEKDDAYFVLWVGAANGYAYQLMCWGNVRDRETIIASAKTLFQRFERIDPERSAYKTNL